MAKLQCIVVTPEQTVCDSPAAFVALPLFDGEIGISPGHTPLIGRLGAGELRISQEESQTNCYYVEGGFVEVIANVITVLTDRAIPVEQLDKAAAKEEFEVAKNRKANNPESMAARDEAVTRSRAQLRLAARQEK